MGDDHQSDHPPDGRWLAPWQGDAAAQRRDALDAARTIFRPAHQQLGIPYEDFAQEGLLKLWRRHELGTEPSRPLLWYCVRMAGIDLLQGDRPGGIRRGRRQGDVVWTVGPFPATGEGLQVEPTAGGDLASPAALVDERSAWEGLVPKLREHFGVVYPRTVAAWPDRVAMSHACGRVGERLARSAAGEVEVRWRYADRPLLTIWEVTRRSEAERFGSYSALAFPPYSAAADRRYAFRLAERVRDAISSFLLDSR